MLRSHLHDSPLFVEKVAHRYEKEDRPGPVLGRVYNTVTWLLALRHAHVYCLRPYLFPNHIYVTEGLFAPRCIPPMDIVPGLGVDPMASLEPTCVSLILHRSNEQLP